MPKRATSAMTQERFSSTRSVWNLRAERGTPLFLLAPHGTAKGVIQSSLSRAGDSLAQVGLPFAVRVAICLAQLSNLSGCDLWDLAGSTLRWESSLNPDQTCFRNEAQTSVPLWHPKKAAMREREREGGREGGRGRNDTVGKTWRNYAQSTCVVIQSMSGCHQLNDFRD